MKNNTYIFDIETGPRDEETILSFTDLDSVPTGNLKDPEKIAAKRAEARAKAIDRAALSALTGEVMAIGWMNPDGTTEIWDGVVAEGEGDILQRFWDRTDNVNMFDRGNPCRAFVGFGIYDFDLPFMIQRSWFHGVKVPDSVRENVRYFNPRYVDLMKVFTCGVYGAYVSLDHAARFLGLEGKCVEGITGATFANFWRDVEHPEARAKAREYIVNDIVQTRRVAERLLGLDRVNIEAAQFEEVAHA